MQIALTFIAVLALWSAVEARGIEECKVSEWKEWGSCNGPEPRSDEEAAFSFSLPATSGGDRGRAMMKVAVEEKTRTAEKLRMCQEENSCPEYNARPTETGQEHKCVDGMAGEYPCRSVDLMSHISIEDLGYTKELQKSLNDKNVRGNDIWGWTDPETGKEYAIVGLSGGTSFVDVTDPINPVVLAFLLTRTGPSIWRDMKVVYDTAYIVSEAKDHGLQVFDLLRLREMEHFSYVESDTDYSLFGNAHNIVSNEETGYVYVVGATQKEYQFSCLGGLHFINVRDRLNPAYAGCFPDDGYVHDAQCVIYHGPDARYQGHEICVCFNEDTLTLVDVTSKDHPTLISKEGYSHAMYTHQGWLTEDHRVVLLDDELDENKGVTPDPTRVGHTITYIWDVSDLKQPILKQHFLSSEVAIDHNQYILDDLTYQSNYGAGLRILHIEQDNYDLNEVAYFDCLPTSSEKAVFEGTWSNYPYFSSQNVIVSSIEYGLFVVRPDYAAMRRDIESNATYMQQTRERTIEYAQAGAVCPGLVESRSCAAETTKEAMP